MKPQEDPDQPKKKRLGISSEEEEKEVG